MTMKNNKMTSKTIKTVLFIGLITTLMVPVAAINANAILIPDSAETTTQADDTSEIPTHAAKLQQIIDRETDKHPDWVGMISWDSHKATIDYLGPASNNPFKLTGKHKSNPDVHIQTPYRPVNARTGIIKDTTSSSTAIYKEVEQFTAKASNVNKVNYDQIVNAMSSNNVHWLQTIVVYDKAQIFGSPGWHVIYDGYTVSYCTEDASFPVVSASLSFNVGDTIQSYIRADSVTAGKYTRGATDINTGAGHSFTYTISGDSGHNINLGRQFNSASNCPFPSGSQAEEENTDNVSKFNFGTQSFTFFFYDTPTSSVTTSVTGFFAMDGCGATVSNVNNPAKSTYTYTGTGCGS